MPKETQWGSFFLLGAQVKKAAQGLRRRVECLGLREEVFGLWDMGWRSLSFKGGEIWGVLFLYLRGEAGGILDF